MNYIIKMTIVFIQIFFLLGCVDKSEKDNVKVFWGLLGEYPKESRFNPYELTREDKQTDVASILYLIRRDYKSAKEIAKLTEIDINIVESKLYELKKCELVKEKDSKFLVNFAFWDESLKDRINSLGLELAHQIVQFIKSEIPNLKETFKESSLTEQGYTWGDVSLIIIGGLLLDTGLNDRGLRKWGIFDKKRDTPIRPGNYYYWYKAVENGWGNYWKFGHDQTHSINSNIWFGMFYGQKKENKINWIKAWDVFNENTQKIIFPLIKNGKISFRKLQSETSISQDSLLAILKEMEKTKVVTSDDGYIFPNFPIFNEKDISLILSKVDSICSKIISDIYIPFLPRIHETWIEIKPTNWEIQNIEKFFIREVYDRPYNLTLDILIEEGIVPPPPVDPPFDYWGINGYFNVL